jgi:methionyl-tRNA formyltransferase
MRSLSAGDPAIRTVYLGTSSFAAAVLEGLSARRHRPELVVTRPDRRQGRGRRTSAPAIVATAERLGIDLAQPESVNSETARAEIAAARPDVVVICAFGGLIKEPLLSDHELLNVHPSLLPRWRGAAPIERTIEAGDERTGVSIMRPIAELDAGPVCLARTIEVRADDDFGSLSARLEPLAVELLDEVLEQRPECVPQASEGVTVAHKIEPSERALSPERPALELERKVRALSPHVGAYLDLGGEQRLQVLRARNAPGIDAPPRGELASAGGRLLLGCADGALELLSVKPAGGREMSAADYLRGRPVEEVRAADPR